MQIEETEIAHIVFEASQNLLTITLKNNKIDFDLDQAQKIIEKGSKLTQNKPTLLFFDASMSQHIPSKEAENYLSSYPHLLAEAVLIKYLYQRIYGNFYIRLAKNNSNCPVRLFTQKEKALQWLFAFSKKNLSSK